MSTRLSGETRFQRRPGICVWASRLGIAAFTLLMAIFPVSARAFQVTAFHPLAPSRPPARSMRPPTAPVAAKSAGGPAKPMGQNSKGPKSKGQKSMGQKSMGKMTPQMRERIAEEMRRESAHRNTPPFKKIGR